MNKIEALKAAQDLQRNKATNGEQVSVNIRDDEITLTGNGVCLAFPFSEPEPLVRDTYIWATNLRLYLYAMGEFSEHGFNKCYLPGRCSKNNDGLGDFISVEEFEIIEAPTDLETMQTPDEMCIQHKCHKYSNKYQRIESEKWLNGECERCQISVSEPTGLKVE